ncbi:MAG: DNA/RNA nuclease SfsA [Firmicutes bacterium]|uniref:Sugar fermentation stimulation protein homolog n=1 Tax=Candidatus Scybalomonas excrementavium TaxID=2840943 RepID=A0A9D9HZU4_9FIRM|nr:DNA/RNA nuclease SfsA [Candidatus Scybalomonas excrementavium]
MKYKNIRQGIFLSRPNRFIAYVELDGEVVKCHVKNTGRCKELLIEGVTVFLEEHDNPNRKTKYSLIGVKKGDILINMDSQAPNKVVEEWLKEGGLYANPSLVKREKTYGNSRFDFYVEAGEKRCFIEVKGVTLEEEQIAKFPDAPTERGIKHIKELCDCRKDGYEAYIIFVIQLKGIVKFEPNIQTQPEFQQALMKAKREGVHILAYDCFVTQDELWIDQKIDVDLKENM